MNNILDTGIKNAKNVDRYIFGQGGLMPPWTTTDYKNIPPY